jgi:hypothetical protein
MISPAIRFQPHETKLQERRNEENSEGRRLQRLKVKLEELRKPELARAS